MQHSPFHSRDFINQSPLKMKYAHFAFAKAKVPRIFKFIEKTLFQTWWVILFILFCYGAYEHTLEKYRHEYSFLYSRLEELQFEKKEALKVQENLQLQINSQSDPQWIELTLMKGLGVVPEGYKKIYFSQQAD